MSMRDDPAGGASHHRRHLRLDPEPHVVTLDADHVEPEQAHQKVAALAAAAGETAAGNRIGHRQGPWESAGVVTPILEGLDLSHPADTPTVGSTLTTRSSTKSRIDEDGRERRSGGSS
ncbi:hypothetical protein [Tessaracoccus antarcticus]|uniref:hypothetical protein n=1 Tax=Tessaracoccus antarcticus TaxID=2479848 RepID=UPI001F34A326|nr:hypothetical protein [Tessaracoccus antarcticus]